MLLLCLLYVAVCSTSLVSAVRSVSKTLAREELAPIGGPHPMQVGDFSYKVKPRMALLYCFLASPCRWAASRVKHLP